MRDGDFSLAPKERAMYGATITARSLDTGATVTIARTNRTAVDAVLEICGLLDAMDDNYRVVCISTPNSIQRDMYASRVSLQGDSVGHVASPERQMLGSVGRMDMIHSSLEIMSERTTRT